MNIISNKHKKNKTDEWGKHPRTSLKKEGNKKLRKEEPETEGALPLLKSKMGKRFKNKRLCPFCLDDIYMQNKDNEMKHHGLCSKSRG